MFSKCSVPWTKNIDERMNDSTENGTVKPQCDIPNAVQQSLALLDFFYRAVAYALPGCKGILN